MPADGSQTVFKCLTVENAARHGTKILINSTQKRTSHIKQLTILIIELRIKKGVRKRIKDVK